MKYLVPLLLLLVVLGLDSCKQGGEKTVPIDLKFESLQDSLPAITTKDQLVSFLKNHAELRENIFGRQRYPSDSVFLNTLFKRFTSPHFDTLLQETHRVFGDLDGLKQDFSKAFGKVKYYYPEFNAPKIVTMISGLEENADLRVADSVLVIGLDYFLGPGAKYRPNMYDYMLRRYNKDFIVPSVMLIYGIDPHFNKTELNDKTVLADMIAYGKAYYFAKQMLPHVADSVLIGYTSEEMLVAQENEDLIYGHLVEREIIYSTSFQIKQRYLEERPKTLDIGERCPGRIATWVGWRIVNSYADHHPDKSLVDIMNTVSAETIFKESKYRPQKK